MSTTDDRIVKMHFDNGSFKKGAADTQKSLADLNKSVDAAGKGTSRGLTDMSSAMSNVSVSASAMTVATTTALATIAHKVTEVGIGMVKGLTFDPIKQGFEEYEANLTKLNTIMNATGYSQERVQGVLNELNRYSDETIYSFANMTASIQKFVNAGIDLDVSAKSVKGIANMAAYAGASTDEASRAMYAFSQSMGTGYMMLNDWMQIENANMGTMQFKQTLIDTAVELGTLTKHGKMYRTESGKMLSAGEGWRDGLQEQWATTEVLNQSLAKYTDQNTKLGREATQSATEVRTFTAFMDTLKESLGSGWATIFRALIGDLEEATTFWTGFATAVGGVVENVFEFGATALETWRHLGGFEKLIGGVKNVLAPFGAILHVIGAAWAAAFPSSDSGAGKALYGLSAGFEAVTRPLKWLADLIEGTTPVITTFFRAIHIGGSIIGAIIGTVVNFVRSLVGLAEIKAPSTGGMLGFIQDIGDAISDAVKKVDDLIRKGASIGQAFGSIDISLPSMPSMPDMPSMPSMGNVLGDSKTQANGVSIVAGSMTALKHHILGVKDASDAVGRSPMFQSSTLASTGQSFQLLGADVVEMGKTVAGSGDEVKSAWDAVVGWIGNAVSTIADKIKSISMNDIVSSFNMAVFVAMGVQLGKLMHAFSGTFTAFMGIGEAANEVIGNAGLALKSFQTQARAKLILNIAIAIGILAASLWLLSTIPADKMTTALTGLGGVVLMLGLVMKQMGNIVEQLDGNKTSLKIMALGVAMAFLGFAMMELAVAMKILDSVDWDGIVKGLVVMGALVASMQTLGKLSAASYKSMLGGAAAIAIMAGAMIVLAGALLLFKMVDWGAMAKAGVTLAALTLAVGLLALIPYAGIAKVGLALLGASLGMLAIANALILFALVKWESIGKAAVVLLLLTASLAALMYIANPISVAMFIALGAAMLYLSFALKNLNDVEWASIGKLALVFGVLLLAVLGLTGALYLLAPVIPVLGLFALALLALGVALALFSAALSVAIALAAGGTAAFVTLATGAALAIGAFMTTLAHEAPVMKNAFLKILKTLIDTIVQAVPMVINGIKRLYEAIKRELSSPDKGAGVGKAGESWMDKIKGAIQKYMPILVQKAKELVIGLIRGLASKAGDVASAGIRLIVSLINGIAREAPKITKAAADLIIKLANGIQDNANRVLDAGVEMIADFLHKLADTIRNGSAAIGAGISDVVDAMQEVGADLVQGLIDGMSGMVGDATSAIGGLVSSVISKAKSALGERSPSKVFKRIGKFLVQGLTLGIQNNAASAVRAVAAMIKHQIALSEDMVNGFIQRLDQRSIAARARAQGLQAAADRAQKAADKTEKTKKDDRAANQLSKQARRADNRADAAERKAKAARAAEARREKWRNADELERAKIKAADAQRQINSAKSAEKAAAAARIEARALDQQARARGVTNEQSRAFRKEADRLMKQSRNNAKRANAQIKNARRSAIEAMQWQRRAGRDAAQSYQKQYREEAAAARKIEAFEKLTDAEKAEAKRKESARLKEQSEKNLALAKRQAYKDIQQANDTAKLALEQAEQARQLVKEAEELEANGPSGQMLNLQPTQAAAVAFNDYADLYDAAYAAAASDRQVVFEQNNYSPESLTPSEIYRQTNNLVTYAADKLQPSAA